MCAENLLIFLGQRKHFLLTLYLGSEKKHENKNHYFLLSGLNRITHIMEVNLK